ncbi:MAG: hypothetical protein ACK5ME_02210 [Parahaliea sp.]
MFYENLKKFAGLPVKDYLKTGDITDFSTICPRVRCEYHGGKDLPDYLNLLFNEAGIETTLALVFGMWTNNGDTYEASPQSALDMMVSYKDHLPALKAFFAGDIISEENEISWIGQGDYSAVWSAFPRLEAFTVRGGNSLALGAISHQALRKIVIQTGGLDRKNLQEALAAIAPIEHFEVLLGDDNYGANTSPDDFGELLNDKLFPRLHTLGLCNSQYSDDLAEAIVKSPLLDRIKVLDLSLGTLTDRGAKALIDSGRLGHLERLDITHHYVSSDVVAELARYTPELIANDAQEPDVWDGETHYYVAVSE